uniref:Uncharacterized protein n=1 Tax=Anguilla anguilla TaxID=7936 RepID=A0A0E9UV86_ANGAN
MLISNMYSEPCGHSKSSYGTSLRCACMPGLIPFNHTSV